MFWRTCLFTPHLWSQTYLNSRLNKQTNNVFNSKLHNLETLDFLTSPTIEEESWLAQNVLKHVFVYAIWLFSLRIVGVSFSIHSTLKTQEKYITNTVGVFKEFLFCLFGVPFLTALFHIFFHLTLFLMIFKLGVWFGEIVF